MQPASFPLLKFIPMLPLIGATVNLIFGAKIQKRWGKVPIHLLACGTVAMSFVFAVVALVKMLSMPVEGRALLDNAWTLLDVDPLKVQFAFYLDQLGVTMTLVVTGVGGLIHIYSIGYMHDEPAYWRFFGYLNLFTFAMLLLVMGDNFILMFFGWEGVGLCSYLLIGFWYTNRDYAKAGMKAFVVNRVGDFGFAIGMFMLFWGLAGGWTADGKYEAGRLQPTGVAEQKLDAAAYQEKAAARHAAHAKPAGEHGAKAEHGREVHRRDYGKKAFSVTFREIAARDDLLLTLKDKQVFGISLVTLICLLLFVGATGKSAQIPLYVWLPDAMAGPTPVSALIHAATMVTAGVYMIARLNFLFSLSQAAMTVVAVVGVATALFAATIGFFQKDIKKVLAYSTVSQLGFMFVGVGVGAFSAGIFHLVTHAFFKAALFLGAGSVIMGMHHEQDMGKMGGLKRFMPKTWLTMAIACWAIAGFPPFSGFFSKDEILWSAFNNANTVIPGWLIWATGTVTAGFTAFYMYRLYFMTFTGENRSLVTGGHAAHGHGHDDHGHHALTEIHESPKTMTFPILTLAGLAAVAGLLGIPHLNVFEHWLEPVFAGSEPNLATKGLPFGMELGFAALSVAVALIGFYVARRLYKDNKSRKPAELAARYPRLHKLIFNKYYIDEVYSELVLKPLLALTRGLAWVDNKVVDGAVNGAAWLVKTISMIDGLIDKYLVDGAVNALSNGTLWLGRRVRQVQTGHIQHYVLGAMAGAMVVILLIKFMV
jgi:NADH-quinone oxidoreductase subunit L